MDSAATANPSANKGKRLCLVRHGIAMNDLSLLYLPTCYFFLQVLLMHFPASLKVSDFHLPTPVATTALNLASLLLLWSEDLEHT